MKHKELAEQAGIGYLYEYEMKWAWLGELEVFAELVRADEREACAKLCDDLQLTDLSIRDWADGTYDCANAIRARSDK